MVKMSTKGRYATRIMVYLALNSSDRPARKREIAESEGIPADYVEQILSKLRTTGLVKSLRGARGGFQIGRDPGDITVADVVASTEGPLSLVACVDEGCSRIDRCVTRTVWLEASNALEAVLTSKTIASLAQLARQMPDVENPQSLSYEI